MVGCYFLSDWHQLLQSIDLQISATMKYQ
uniref:Uncharacterized protein n=1 Tax=Arundo donax TaxID=35708 RepID=A0A0A9HHV4_ARUDO